MRASLRSSSIALGVALAAAACGGVGSSGTPASGGGGSASAGGTPSGALSTLGFGLPDEIATVRVNAFKEANPGVRVKINQGSFDAQQFLSAVASGNPPDVVYISRDVLGTYAGRGALQPMDQCVKDRHIDMSQYREPAVKQLTLQGKLYGLPDFYSVRILMANKKALSAAGARVSDVKMSDPAAVQALGARLVKKSGGKITRIGVDPKLPEFFPLWAHAYGADLVSADGKTAQLSDPKAVAALRDAVALVKQNGTWSGVKAFKASWDFFGAKNQYAKNQIGVSPLEDWYLNVLADVSPKAPFAAGAWTDKQGKPVTYATGQAWAIPKGAKNPAAACAFAASMTSKESWIAASKARAAKRAAEKKPYTGTYTGNKAADEVIFSSIYKPSGNAAIDGGVKTVLGVQDAAFTTPASPAASEVNDAWSTAVNRVLEGKQTPEAALGAAQKVAQKALDTAWKK